MQSNALLAYRNTGLRQVEGWGIDEDLFDLIVHLDAFQSQHGIRGPVAEIGVHHGRTLILLALLAKADERVVGIDLFEDRQIENLDSSGSGSLALAKANCATHAPGVKVDLIAANSFDLSQTQLESFHGARLFHLDGGHFIEVVLNDLAIVQSALGNGGIVIIDDYWHSLFPEVHEAVCRYFSGANLLKAVPFMTGRNKIFLAHTSHRDRLLRYMSDQLPADRRRKVKLLGYESICCDSYL